MARKEKIITIQLEGRDKGKQFKITEMPASKAEKWAARAFLALAHANIQIPDEIRGAGMAAIAVIGLRALGAAEWKDAEPLLDEMMACIQAVPDPRITRELVENDIEEVATRLFLRDCVFELHTGFSVSSTAIANNKVDTESGAIVDSISTFRKRV